MNRRTFLSVFGGLIAVEAVALSGLVRNAVPGLTRRLDGLSGWGLTPRARLERHYAWLAIEPAAIDSYLSDYERYIGPPGRFSRDREFFTRFLLSTDFFVANGAHRRHGAPVSYSLFYEPGVSPCYNPLASRAGRGL